MSSSGSLPYGVIAPLRRITDEIGREVFSFSDVIGYIERNRRKPLRIEEDDMPAGMTGYAVALRDCDLICTHRHLSATQKLVTQLHEMAHFIRGDIPALSAGDETTTYDRFIHSRDRHKLCETRERIFDMYNTAREHDTETLARILLQRIRAYENNIPSPAKQIYSGGL